jgi:hypothetical protein
MSVPADRDPACAEAYAPAKRIVEWVMGRRKRPKPEYFRKKDICENMSPVAESGGQDPSRSRWPARLGKVFRAVKTALTPPKEYSQLPLFQAKPESYRKGDAYKNMSKALGWLGAAVGYTLPCSQAQRAKIVLPAAEGLSNEEI